ncbi:MAG: hypothetical protein ACQET7_04355 [Thermodesulfobacteriota bacterium]
MNRTLTDMLPRVVFVGAFISFLLLLSPADLLAQEGPSQGRKIYDTIMLWVNFGILAFVFMKYGKPALVSFLYGERNKIEKALQEIEEDMKIAKRRVEEESKNLEGIDEYLQQIKGDILEMGEREKIRILEDARSNANQMIKDAENELALKMEEARRALNDRVVDQAVNMASEKLTKKFTEQDNEKQIEGFMGSLDQVRGQKMLTV